MLALIHEHAKVIRDRPTEEALITALGENWKHARHAEEQRAWHLNLYMLALAAILAIAFRDSLPLHEILANSGILFGFLFVLSIYVFFNVTKLNVEFSNHIWAIQWISEKLSLNKPLTEERKEKIKKVIAEGKLSEKESKDVMFQGYMALPLPVPMRVHEIFQKLMYLFIFGTAWSAISGLAIRLNLFSFLQSLPFPAIQLPIEPLRLSAYIFGIIGAIILCVYCKKKEEQVKAKAEKLIDLREPEEIRIRYREKRGFHENSK